MENPPNKKSARLFARLQILQKISVRLFVWPVSTKRICTPLLGRPQAGQRCRALRNCITPPLRIYDIPNKKSVRLFGQLQILHKKLYASWPAGHSTKNNCTPLILPLSPKKRDVSFLWNPKKRDVSFLWRDPGALTSGTSITAADSVA